MTLHWHLSGKFDHPDGPKEQKYAKYLWRDDPRRDDRLFDWLDAHDAECKVLFASGPKGRLSKLDRGGQKSKKSCYVEAAKAIFLADDDPALRREVATDEQKCGTMVSSHILSLKRTYQQVNERIGREASNTKYQDLDPASHSLLESFPHWKRLHLHWRTRSAYNQFWSKSDAEVPSSKQQEPARNSAPSLTQVAVDPSGPEKNPQAKAESSGTVNSNKEKKTRKCLNVDAPSEVIVLTDNDNEEPPEGDTQTVMQATTPVENIPLPRRTRRQRKRKRLADNTEDDEQLIQAEDNQEGPAHAEPNTLSAVQIHERELAEIAYKRQKLENEALEKRTAAEIRRLELEAEERRRMAEDDRQREKERHELLMKVIEMGLPALVGTAKAKPVTDGEGNQAVPGNDD